MCTSIGDDAWATDAVPGVDPTASGGPLGGPAASAHASLERLETKRQTLGISVQSAAAHARYGHERSAILDALNDDPQRIWARRVPRMVDCCCTPAVGLTASGKVGAIWFRCRDRLCPLCAAARSRQVSDRVMTAIRSADSLRFLTLTRAHTDAPLKDQLDALYASYRDLRRTVEWKRHVVGGIATIEIERNEKTGQWHPHLHVLIDGNYWPHASIKATWKAVTGDSEIVWIKQVPSRRKIANYVAKYASKPAAIADWPPDVIREYAAAIHRRRLVLATGNMHASKVDRDEEPERDAVVGERIPLHALERRSQAGCRRAAVVLGALAMNAATYQNAMGKRPAGTLPNLAPPQFCAGPGVARCWAELHALWADDPVCFINGGSGNWVKPTPPKRPPGRGRMRDSTAAIADWLSRDTRHI